MVRPLVLGAQREDVSDLGRASARTNEAGMARFSLPTAASSVAVSAPGFNLSVDDLSRDRAGFRLTRGDGVTFRVLDRDGVPVPRAVIRVGEYQAIPLALTNDRGEATVGLGPEHYVAADQRKPLLIELKPRKSRSARR